MRAEEIEAIEVELLLEALVRRWGYDFRAYAQASVRRRIRQFLTLAGEPSPTALLPRILHDEGLFRRLIRGSGRR